MKSGKFIKAVVITSLALAGVSPAFAQDISDIEGAKRTTAEETLRSWGYSGAGTKTMNSRNFHMWQNKSRNRCMGFTVDAGMVEDAESFQTSDCKSASGGDTGAIVAGAAVAAILGAALLSHGNNHHKDGKHLSGNASEADYERGYRDGRNGSESYNYDHNPAYSDGYNAGHRERSNQMEGSRHSYDSMRRAGSGAPGAARSACAREADQFWNIPAGSAVATDSTNTGGDVWLVTVQSGYDTARCTVNSAGNVEGIDG
jgi:hypothetical protein